MKVVVMCATRHAKKCTVTFPESVAPDQLIRDYLTHINLYFGLLLIRVNEHPYIKNADTANHPPSLCLVFSLTSLQNNYSLTKDHKYMYVKE